MITLRTKPCRKCGRFEFYESNSCVFCKLQNSQRRYYSIKMKKAIAGMKALNNPVVEVVATKIKVNWFKNIWDLIFNKKND